MGWVRLDDAFYDHRKFAAVGPIGVACFVVGLAHANRNLTNGFISFKAAKALVDCDGLGVMNGMAGRDADAMDGVAELVEAGLWDEAVGGYQIHDYLDYQPSADEVKAQREKNAIRQANWRSKTSSKVSIAVSNGVTSTVSDSPVTGAPNPNPNPRKTTAGAQARGQRINENWKPTDADIAWARSEGYDDLSQRRETEKFVDHFLAASGQTAKKLDWSRAWKNWLRNSKSAPTKSGQRYNPDGTVVGEGSPW